MARAITGGGGGEWTVKYYKGLGTSTKADGCEYFRTLAQHTITYTWSTHCDDALYLAFDKTRADDRKAWLSEYSADAVYLDSSARSVSLSEYVNR